MAMWMRAAACVIVVQAVLSATECHWVPEPCKRVSPWHVYFVGEIVGSVREVPSPYGNQYGKLRYHEYRVRVKEPLLGFRQGNEGQLLILPNVNPHNTAVLFEMQRKADGSLALPICTITGPIAGARPLPEALAMVEYLRALRDGAVDDGSVTILLKPYAVDKFPVFVEDARIRLDNGKESREIVATGRMAHANRLRPGTYSLTATKLGLVEATEPETTKQFIVSPRSCFSVWVTLIPVAR